MAGNLDFLLNLRANTRGLDDIRNGTSQLVQSFYDATRALSEVNNASELSTESIEQMANHGRQVIDQMNAELRVAQLELNRLSATNATPQDIEAARERVAALERGIGQASAALDTYRDAAAAATEVSPVPSQFQEDVSSLVTELDSARRSIDENGNSATHTRQQLEDMARRASNQIDQYEKDLRDARLELNRLSATNATPQDIEAARERIRELERGIDQSRTSLDGLNDAFGNTEEVTGRAFGGASKGINGARFAVNALAGAMAALGVGLGINELAQAADSYTNLSARINIATKDGGDFASAMAGVHQVALMTNSSLEATGSLFTRLNAVGKDMGMSQQQALDLTKTVTQAIQVGGGSAQASEAAVQQFIQAMQGGVLRGEEFNSIMENGYGLAEALAKGLGVTTGELRKMAENGELSSERVIKAAGSQAAAIQATYDQFPTTIGNAMQRISTSWEILIGKMDQANGSSATVAQWLVTLADNIAELDTVLLDIGEGFVWVGDQLKKVDPATIDALKTALIGAYDSLKALGSTVGTLFEAVVNVINTVLAKLFDFNSAVDSASDKTSGFTKALQIINIALGALGDGFEAIGIGVNAFVGALYSAASAWAGLVSRFTWGDVRAEAIANMQSMQAKAEEFYQKASDGAINFKSKAVAALDEISKTRAQKDAEAIASSKETLDKLLADQSAEAAGKKASEDEKLKAVQEYAEAAIAANGSVMDGVMQADLMTKGYIVTIDQAGKVSVLAGESAEKAAEKAKAKEEALKLAKENVKKADEEYLAYQKKAAVERVILEKQIEDAKRTGDLNALLSAQASISGINEREKELAKNRELRITELNNITSGSGQVAANAADKARQAATALDLSLDVALNRVSAKFKENKTHLDNLAVGLKDLGAKGKQAGDVTYQAWVKWLETAKSQAEIDLATARLQEFGKTGQLSAKQVELGMQAVRQVIQKLPADLDPVEQAFERLGIKTKEQLALAAQSALADFNTIQSSGKATADGLREAYERTMQAAAASGDAAVIASTQAKAASLGLQVQVDETGKASVQSMDEWAEANHRVRDSAGSISDGYREAGAVAREEAKSASDAWQEAVEKSNQEFKAELKNQQSMLSSLSDYESYSRGDVIKQIESMGYDSAEAKRLAGSIWSKGLEADRDAKYSGMGGFGPMDLIIDQEFDRAAAKGLTTQNGTNKINDLLRQLAGGSMVARTNAPTVSTPSAPRTVQNNISINGKTISIPVTEDSQGDFNDFLSELEKLKKAM